MYLRPPCQKGPPLPTRARLPEFSNPAHFLPLDPLPHFCYFPALLQHKGAVHEILGNYRNDGRCPCRQRMPA